MKKWSLQNKNRKAAFAGQFYPAEEGELENLLANLFDVATPSAIENKNLQAIISPHAGYIFSGEVAASAFNQISEKSNYKRVFVLASSHQYSFNGASVYCDGNYETPLGKIDVDTTLAEELIASSDVFLDKPEVHFNEHSLEVQLPFLQYKLGSNFQLVPIIIGANSSSACKQIASSLEPWFTSENLFVISTDFSHYPDYENATKVDKLTANSICLNNPDKLEEILIQNKNFGIENLSTSLCGWTSVLTLLYLTEKEDFQFKKITYQNSGDSKVYGDKDRVVGYWAISVSKNENSITISKEEKDEILSKARNSIKSFLETGKRRKPLKPNAGNGILNEITGAFVSIYVKGKLRGCIGGFAQDKTLNDLVQHMAVSAALDHRFKALDTKDMGDMEIEISVLSPLKKIESADEIELGKHGIFIQQGINTGTFLPQVAKKTGWDVKQFLGHCSRDKAGIGWDGWKSAELFTYEAVIFKGR